jgi:glutaminyl-tRNA synthetase
VLRAKIDMATGNISLRDPRSTASHATHPRTGNTWHIYPSYDAHGQSDAIEGITHSICTLNPEITGRSTTGFDNLPVPSRRQYNSRGQSY